MFKNDIFGTSVLVVMYIKIQIMLDCFRLINVSKYYGKDDTTGCHTTHLPKILT